jgi:hypothetical protein
MSKLASSSVQNVSAEELNTYFRPLKYKELSKIEKMQHWLAFFEAPPSHYNEFDEADVKKARQELAQHPRLSHILDIIAIGNAIDKEKARPAGSEVELSEIKEPARPDKEAARLDKEAARPAGSEVDMSEIVYAAARPAGPESKFYEFGLGGGKSRRVKSRRVKSRRNKRRTQHRNTRK